MQKAGALANYLQTETLHAASWKLHTHYFDAVTYHLQVSLLGWRQNSGTTELKTETLTPGDMMTLRKNGDTLSETLTLMWTTG